VSDGADRLSALLSGALGEANARELVARAAKDAQVDLAQLTRANALEILERLASEPGIVGITARFAKSRAVLQRWDM
jgi:hypothetical protein